MENSRLQTQKQIVPKKKDYSYFRRSSHKGDQRMQALIRFMDAKIVKKCKAWTLTNVVANDKNPSNRFKGTKPRVY